MSLSKLVYNSNNLLLKRVGMDQREQNKETFNNELLTFLDNSPTPFHATKTMKTMLGESGFIELDESESWSLEYGKRYYVTRNSSSIIAFNYHETQAYTMVGAHTDSPNLKIKPNPVVCSNNIIQLGVEPYGGLLLNPWFDRDLSIAGRVMYLDGEENICEAFIDFKEPLAIISSLAIHLDKEANKNRTINAQTDIVPLLATGDELNFEAMLTEELAKEGHEPFSILSHELSFYDVQKASYVGLSRDFIASARLDNLLSCYVATKSIIEGKDSAMLMVCSDHEEVGSESTSGAAGPFLENIISRLSDDNEKKLQLLRKSVMISADNAHAIHPNFTSKHEPQHAPKINKGVVIKINANQRYASNAPSMAKFIVAAQKVGVGIQKFVTRSDMGCGSTIGPITATRLGIETIDIGLPTYAMHSIRELAGSDDAYELFEILSQLAKS